MRRGLVFAVCALMTGCLKEPKFNGNDTPRDADGDAPDGPDGSTIPDVTASTAGVAVIQGQHFRMQFASGGGHFPDSLTIGGTEMLGDAMACNAEHKLGIALFPTLLISDLPQPGANPQGPPTATLTGPVVAQMTVPFSHFITCNSVTRTIAGQTTFTAFPDGRIVRHDDLDISGMLDSTQCNSCTSAQPVDDNFFLTTFATIHADAGDSVTNFDVSGITLGNEMTAPGNTFCTDYDQRQLALAFFTDGSDQAGTRIRLVGDSPRTFAFVHDVVRGADSIDTSHSRNFSTTMLLGRDGSCMADAMRASALLARPVLIVGPYQFPIGLHGIYAGSDLGPIGLPTGPFDLRPAAGEIPAGFAVWFELGTQQPGTAVMVQHSNASKMTGEWFRRQSPAAGNLILYFRDSLAPGETITVTPPPPI